ncbi:MAG TPA: hypothetical protein VFW96_19800 [Thermomicrobiales bacterium]|nr:hypothetical protein [Thermomicrobiales bacterium]
MTDAVTQELALPAMPAALLDRLVARALDPVTAAEDVASAAAAELTR